MFCKSLKYCSNIKDIDVNSRHSYLLPVFSKLVQSHTAYNISKWQGQKPEKVLHITVLMNHALTQVVS